MKIPLGKNTVSTRAHTFVSFTYRVRMCASVCVCLCMQQWRRERRLRLRNFPSLCFMLLAAAAAASLASWQRRVDVVVVATSRCRHLSFPSISNTSNCNIATKSVSRVFVLALSLLLLCLRSFHVEWEWVVWRLVPLEWAKLKKGSKAKIEVFESKRRNKKKNCICSCVLERHRWRFRVLKKYVSHVLVYLLMCWWSNCGAV